MTASNGTAPVLTGFVLACLLAAHATAQVPDGIDYQGYLADGSGSPIDQPVNVQFALYTVENGGVPVWTQTVPLEPELGLFSTTLGGVASPFPAGLFSTPLWMGITIGTDAEMAPRRALSSVAYSKRAVDADTLGGLPPSALDQSVDVQNLSDTLSNTNVNVNALSADVAGNTAAISAVATEAGTNAADIATLQTDVAAAEADVDALEGTIPTLQPLVSGVCPAGSSIRQIFANGTVSCETDDGGLWSQFNNNVFYTTGSVGVGTSSPAAAVQIDAPSDVDPFRARVAASTKLRVFTNGSVSLGGNDIGPDNGIQVAGNARIGIGTASARLTASDPLWQAALNNNGSGGDDWYLGASATGWNIGAGKFAISPTNSSGNSALVIDSNKDIGIGTTDPQGRLHVDGGTDVAPASGGYFVAGSAGGTNIAIDNNEIMARSNGAVAPLSLNVDGGEVRVNTNGVRDENAFEVRGRARFDSGDNSDILFSATNSNPTNAVLRPSLFEEGLVGESAAPFWRVYSREFYASSPIEYKTYSDGSLKRNVRPIPDALATVQALEGVTYELAKHPMDTRDRQLTPEQDYDRRHQLGFIAQQVEKVFPQMVSDDESSGLKTVGYMALIPVLVEAVKEQQRQIDAQREEIEILKGRLR